MFSPKRKQGTRRDAQDKSNDFASKNRVARRWPAEGHTQKKKHADGATGAKR